MRKYKLKGNNDEIILETDDFGRCGWSPKQFKAYD